jgi:hypothetical protein
MTTIPGRIDKIRRVVESVLNQKGIVVSLEINIPKEYKKTGAAVGQTYTIPEWLRGIPNVTINEGVVDYGPATKVAHTLMKYSNDGDVHIWSVDDDWIYPDDTLKGFIEATSTLTVPTILAYEGAEFGAAGFTNGIVGDRVVNIVEGFRTILYPPKAVADVADFENYMNKAVECDAAKFQDDVVLSNYFAKRGIPRRLVPILTHAHEQQHSKNANALHQTGYGNVNRANRAKECLEKAGIWYIPKTQM